MVDVCSDIRVVVAVVVIVFEICSDSDREIGVDVIDSIGIRVEVVVGTVVDACSDIGVVVVDIDSDSDRDREIGAVVVVAVVVVVEVVVKVLVPCDGSMFSM